MTFYPIEIFPNRNPISICDYFKDYIKDKSVCDIGCGAGDILEYLRINKLCKEVSGIEISPERYVKERLYITLGNAFNGIPVADVYYIWQCRNFPYEKIFKQFREDKLVIIANGSEKNHELIENIKGLTLVKKVIYEYDEEKFTRPENLEEYKKSLTQFQKINAEWLIKGKRFFKIYNYKV
jgi:SAM-dependent methyltransferase